MFARYYLSVHNTPTGEGEATIRFGGPRSVVVTASASEDNKDTLVLIAKAEFEPDDRVLEVFMSLAADVLPKDAEPYQTLSVRVEPGESLDRHVPSPDVLPGYFRPYAEKLRDEMSEQCVAKRVGAECSTFDGSRRMPTGSRSNGPRCRPTTRCSRSGAPGQY